MKEINKKHGLSYFLRKSLREIDPKMNAFQIAKLLAETFEGDAWEVSMEYKHFLGPCQRWEAVELLLDCDRYGPTTSGGRWEVGL